MESAPEFLETFPEIIPAPIEFIETPGKIQGTSPEFIETPIDFRSAPITSIETPGSGNQTPGSENKSA